MNALFKFFAPFTAEQIELLEKRIDHLEDKVERQFKITTLHQDIIEQQSNIIEDLSTKIVILEANKADK